jgi:hypothetical protein
MLSIYRHVPRNLCHTRVVHFSGPAIGFGRYSFSTTLSRATPAQVCLLSYSKAVQRVGRIVASHSPTSSPPGISQRTCECLCNQFYPEFHNIKKWRHRVYRAQPRVELLSCHPILTYLSHIFSFYIPTTHLYLIHITK